MKFRQSLVSNSSSCSFIINKNELTENQYNVIKNLYASESYNYFLLNLFTDEDGYDSIIAELNINNIPYERVE